MDLRKFFGRNSPSKRRHGPDDSGESAAKRPRLAERIYVNRSPVAILWGAVCARYSLDLEWNEAYSIASAAASMLAGKKAASLDLGGWGRTEDAASMGVLGLSVPVRETADGVRGLDKEGKVIEAGRVLRLLEAKFEDQLEPLRDEMDRVARTHSKDALAAGDGHLAYELYTTFRPDVPDGRAGWGAKGNLDVALLRAASLTK